MSSLPSSPTHDAAVDGGDGDAVGDEDDRVRLCLLRGLILSLIMVSVRLGSDKAVQQQLVSRAGAGLEKPGPRF